MKNFITKIITFLMAFFSLCYILQLFADKGLRLYMDDQFKDWNLAFSGKINSDILILGSSRAFVQYNPQIIEKSTNKSCYNLGIDGGPIQIQQTKWKSYIQNNDYPQYVIQNIDIFAFEKKTEIFNKSQFIPYLNNDTIYNVLKNTDQKLYFDKYIPLYKYHGYIDLFVKGLLANFNIKINENYTKYNGYKGNNEDWNNDFENYKKNLQSNEIIYNLDSLNEGINILKSIISDCRERNIEFIMVQAPIYYELLELMPQRNEITYIFEDLAKEENVEFWDFSNDSLCYSNEFFYNSGHLNMNGSELFSEKIASKLNEIRISSF